MSLRLFVFLLSLVVGGAAVLQGEDAPAFRVVSRTETQLSWGAARYRLEARTPAGRVVLHYLLVEPERVRLVPVFPSQGLGALASLEEMARDTGAVAGINGHYFDPATGLPVGFLLQDGRVLTTPYDRRGTLAMGFFGRLYFLNPRIGLVLRTPSGGVPLDAVNRPAFPNALIAYTSEYTGPWGAWQEAWVVEVQGGRVRRIEAGGRRGAGAHLRPREPEDLLIVATGSARSRLKDLLPADRVALDYLMEPERYLIRDALQAGPLLLQEGDIIMRSEGFRREFIEKRAARSAVARMGDGRVLLLVAIEENGSVGVDLYELARMLRGLGAMDALALDGGGSSSLAFREGGRWRTVGGRREIPVGLVLLLR